MSVLWVVGGLCLPVTVKAQTLPSIIELSAKQTRYTLGKNTCFFEDKSNQLGFFDVLKLSAKFKHSTKENLNFGYSKSTYWLKFKVTKKDASTALWLINLDYPLIDYAILYNQDKQGNWQVQQNGDQYPVSARTIKTRTIVFPLANLATNHPHTFYMKIKTGGTMQLPLYIQNYGAFYEQQTFTEIFYGIFIGILILIGISNIFLGITFRSWVYFYYVMYIGGWLMFFATISGHTYLYIWGESPYLGKPMIIISSGIVVSSLPAFTRHFLKIRQSVLLKILNTLTVTGIVLMGLAFVVNYSKIIQLVTGIVVFTSGMDLVLFTLEKLEGDKTKLVFAGAKSSLYYISRPYATMNRLKGANLFVGDLNKQQKKMFNQEVILEKGSILYTGSDGISDQNDANRERLGMQRLQAILQQNATLPMTEQKRVLEETLDQHQQDTTQRDDMLWMGIKL